MLLTCEDGVMNHRGQPVPTVTIAEALAAFLEYLALFDHPCLLVAHNCKSFDSRIFMFHEMINAFKEVCLGFSDENVKCLNPCFWSSSKGYYSSTEMA